MKAMVSKVKLWVPESHFIPSEYRSSCHCELFSEAICWLTRNKFQTQLHQSHRLLRWKARNDKNGHIFTINQLLCESNQTNIFIWNQIQFCFTNYTPKTSSETVIKIIFKYSSMKAMVSKVKLCVQFSAPAGRNICRKYHNSSHPKPQRGVI